MRSNSDKVLTSSTNHSCCDPFAQYSQRHNNNYDPNREEHFITTQILSHTHRFIGTRGEDKGV